MFSDYETDLFMDIWVFTVTGCNSSLVMNLFFMFFLCYWFLVEHFVASNC